MASKECIEDIVGVTPEGYRVLAVTDSGGSQVIVGGHDFEIHLLSNDYETHESALISAREVVRVGIAATSGYYNLKDPRDGFASFTRMMITFQIKRDMGE